MPAGVYGQRFYGDRIPAWHGLGIVSQDKKAQEAFSMLCQTSGGYYFGKQPVKVLMEDGSWREQKNHFAIVRSPVPDDPEPQVFDFVTGRYNILQPLRVCELFDENVNEYVETMGFLSTVKEKQGDRMFLTWKLPAFDVIRGDTIELYGFIAVGFDAKMGASLNVVTIRVVCQNTWNAAMAEADEATKKGERGRGRLWSGKHTDKNLEGDFADWLTYVQTNAQKQVALLKDFFKLIAKTPVKTDGEVLELLYTTYPDPTPLKKNAFMPTSARKREEEKIELAANSAKKDRDGIYSLWSGAGTQITPNYWGIWNATTEWYNFGKMEKKRPEVSIMDGDRRDSMNTMAEVLAYAAQKKA